MAYEEVNLRDMKWDLDLEAFTYECPCGDLFQITIEDMENGEDIAYCPSCSLVVYVEYDDDVLDEAKERVRRQDTENNFPPAGPKAITA